MIEVRAEGFEGSTGFGFRSARAAGVAAGAAGLSRLGFLSPERSDRFFLSAGSADFLEGSLVAGLGLEACTEGVVGATGVDSCFGAGVGSGGGM